MSLRSRCCLPLLVYFDSRSLSGKDASFEPCCTTLLENRKAFLNFEGYLPPAGGCARNPEAPFTSQSHTHLPIFSFHPSITFLNSITSKGQASQLWVQQTMMPQPRLGWRCLR